MTFFDIFFLHPTHDLQSSILTVAKTVILIAPLIFSFAPTFPKSIVGERTYGKSVVYCVVFIIVYFVLSQIFVLFCK